MVQKAQVSLIAFSLLFFFQGAKAQDFKTQSVSIFKNGQSFFIKSGKVKTGKGVFKMKEEDVPAALFGSLWFHSPSAGIEFVKSYPDTLEEKNTRAAAAFHELLSINKGKRLIVYLNDERNYDGVVEEIVLAEKPAGNSELTLYSIVTMKRNAGGWASFYANQIKQIEFLEKPKLTMEQVDKFPKNTVEVKFANPNTDQSLDMMYLRNGLTWAPEYLLELKTDTKADLTLQAEIANNGEDLEDVKLNLVVGVPNFKFADRQSFLVDFVQEMGTSMFGAAQSQVMLSNAITFNANSYEMDAPIATPIENVEGGGNEDFFFYGLKNFSLPKGGRAMQPIFKEQIDIAHIFETNLPESNTNQNYNEDFFFSSDNSNKVFHTIRVNNTSGQPWTTGSVFILNAEGEKRPVSQDMLTYTSSGNHSFIKVTEATDIKIKMAEKEISRAENAKKFFKNTYPYDLVKVEGKVEIRNFKNEEIDLNVRRAIYGELGDTNMPWLETMRGAINGNPNKGHNVCWEMKVGAGKVVEVVYTYEVYVRN